jgi:RNA polymerase sigma factor (sigma-70 family)
LLERLREAVLRPSAVDVSDGQLLERYLAGGEEAAFALLLRRHGPMVLGVCRRVLRQEQDAEDAFQATFLVLVRRAATIVPGQSVGPWLYGVAHRTALKVRSLAARRAHVERQAARQSTLEDREPEDWRPLIDHHLSRLPERYRAPLVLCDLQGRARGDVARQLGLPEGTLSSRLARGRALLGQRLRRHGVALSAVGLAAVLGGNAGATPPAALTSATTTAALAMAAGQPVAVPAHVLVLTEGVLRAMTLTRLKIASVVLLSLAVLGLGGGTLGRRALADRPAAPAPEAAPADKKAKEEVGPSVTVTLKAIDAGKQTLTGVVGNKKERQEKTYELARDVSVLLKDGLTKPDEGKAGSLKDLTPGRSVELQLSPGGKTVTMITLRPWHEHGGVVSVNADKRTITIASKSENGPVEGTFTLVKEGRVRLNDGLTKGGKDEEGKLADLAEGTTVLVLVSAVDPKMALEVRPSGRGLSGELKGVDAGNGRITITVKEDGGLVDKELEVVKDARISIDDANSTVPAKLADLKVGSRVVIRLSVLEPVKAAHITEQR